MPACSISTVKFHAYFYNLGGVIKPGQSKHLMLLDMQDLRSKMGDPVSQEFAGSNPVSSMIYLECLIPLAFSTS